MSTIKYNIVTYLQLHVLHFAVLTDVNVFQLFYQQEYRSGSYNHI